MYILGFPWPLMIAAILLVVICSVGEAGPVLYNGILRKVGFVGTGLLIVYVFMNYCVAVGVQFVMPLIAVALFTRLIMWMVKRAEAARKPVGRV